MGRRCRDRCTGDRGVVDAGYEPSRRRVGYPDPVLVIQTPFMTTERGSAWGLSTAVKDKAIGWSMRWLGLLMRHGVGLSLPYFLWNASTRPAVSTVLCRPVNHGWQFEQTAARRFGVVERVWRVAPQVQVISVSAYGGCLSVFMRASIDERFWGAVVLVRGLPPRPVTVSFRSLALAKEPHRHPDSHGVRHVYLDVMRTRTRVTRAHAVSPRGRAWARRRQPGRQPGTP
jgi:hypothetical protein